MSEEHQFTSTEIFLQYCQAKPEKATAFITDYIAYNLDVSNPFNNDSYANVRQYIFDFMVACDKILNFYIYYLSLPQTSYTREIFSQEIERELTLENQDLCDYFYGVFLSNLDKISMLKNKQTVEYDGNEMKNYYLNLQMDLGHSNISNLDNEFKVLLKIEKENNNKEIFEIDEKDLDPFINKLKDIYCQIKC